MTPATPKRIVFATLGSLGDLHPCLAMALELQHRGHAPVIASTEFYRAKVKASGLPFRPIRPDWDPTDPALIRRCEGLKTGPEVLIRELILPHLQDTYDDLLEAVRNADLMVAGELVYAAPVVAETTGIRWASAILSPCSFLSAYDPSVLVNMPSLIRLRRAGWRFNRLILDLGRVVIRSWWAPVRHLRRQLGLGPGRDPLTQDKFSPDLVLALFSSTLVASQIDWPSTTVQPGFLFYDHAREPAGELHDFLAAGAPPIVFTLGSTAVHHPGNFYTASIEAARQLGMRALLIGGVATTQSPSSNVLQVPYASYATVFPRAAAIVHQGGSGTTGQALRAGRPTLIVPYGWDQPDNAARTQRLRTGLTLTRKQYAPATAAASLQRLLTDPQFSQRAMEAARHLKAEDGLTAACDSIESLLRRS